MAAALFLIISTATPSASLADDEIPAKYSGPTERASAPSGIRLAVVSCGAAFTGCTIPGRAAMEVAEKLGWEARFFDGKGNAKDQTSAFLDAIAWGANVILSNSIDHRSLQLPLKEAKAKGILVASMHAAGDTPNPKPVLESGQIGFDFSVDVDQIALGQAIGRWIVMDSGGNANIVAYRLDEIEGAALMNQGLAEALGQCPGCKVDSQPFALSQVGALGGKLVDYLQRNPQTNYVFCVADPICVGMVNSIRQAGMGKRVKVVGLLGDEQNLNFIRNGDIQVADAAYDLKYMGYATVDQVIRWLNKQALFEPRNENVPYRVLDATNVPASGRWHASYDYEPLYFDLWKSK